MIKKSDILWTAYEEPLDNLGNILDSIGTVIDGYHCLFVVVANKPIYDTHTIMYNQFHTPKTIFEPDQYKFYRHDLYISTNDYLARQRMAMTELEMLAKGELP